MEVRWRSSVSRSSVSRRSGLTVAGPLIFLLVIWLGAYFAWRIVHGDRAEQGVVTHIVYPDSRVGRATHDIFMPLRRLDERYLGVRSSRAAAEREEDLVDA